MAGQSGAPPDADAINADKLWAINAGYQTLAFTLMGVILGAWH